LGAHCGGLKIQIKSPNSNNCHELLEASRPLALHDAACGTACMPRSHHQLRAVRFGSAETFIVNFNSCL
jgi:hypothetical protein